jgi:hypothetical protein
MLMSSKGRSLTGTNAFGIVSVRGFKRVPSPAARIIACLISLVLGYKVTKKNAKNKTKTFNL